MKRKILVADDISSNLKLMQAILKKADYDVIPATSGEEAVKKCRDQQPDLVLMDIMMPGMNGYEACSLIKENPETRAIPVIFLSARSEKESVIKGLESGGQDYIAKPFHAQEFLLRVQIHLDLKEKEEQLAKMNLKLEEMVESKTAEIIAANRRLAKLDAAKNNFLDLIAHELRTPLNGIMGISHILGNSPLNEKQKNHLAKLKESAERLERFSEMALLITTINADGFSLETGSIDIREPLEEALRYVQERITEKALNMEIDRESDLPRIEGNEDLVRETLIIVVRNAVKYAPPNTTITIRLCRGPHGTLSLIVEDEGPGFSSAALEHLFSFFSSEDISHHQAGLGLGLALAKMIMDIHHGYVDIENRENGGAQVTLGFSLSSS